MISFSFGLFDSVFFKHGGLNYVYYFLIFTLYVYWSVPTAIPDVEISVGFY